MSVELIKQLREKTSLSISQCKEALEEAGNDLNKAIEILRKKGEKVAQKKSAREIKAGIIDAYIHGNKKVGVMLELGCETDFVARDEEFQELAHDLALHIAAMSPKYLKFEDIPQNIIESEKEIYREEFKNSGKPKKVIDEIINGKLKKYSEEVCLLSQPFVKNPEITVNDFIIQKIAKFGENIQVRRFVRYEI